ncbi:MAG: hypothetical protein ACLQIB_25860 [Isosphaeraceae bacterium]
MPLGLLSLRGPIHWRQGDAAHRLRQPGVARPAILRRRNLIAKPGLWSRGGAWECSIIPKEVVASVGDKSTDLARGSGQVRQGKWL